MFSLWQRNLKCNVCGNAFSNTLWQNSSKRYSLDTRNGIAIMKVFQIRQIFIDMSNGFLIHGNRFATEVGDRNWNVIWSIFYHQILLFLMEFKNCWGTILLFQLFIFKKYIFLRYHVSRRDLNIGIYSRNMFVYMHIKIDNKYFNSLEFYKFLHKVRKCLAMSRKQ